jgi:predicted nucleic acid-binding protein
LVLVDTNVLLDVITDDPHWADWSQHQLRAAALSDRLAINAVIYAEASINYEQIEDLDAVLDTAGIAFIEIPRPALFLAGKVFRSYRKAGGTKTGVLPDFFIGAHAAVAKLRLLTRDPRRYRNYYPTAELIAPQA